MKVNFKEVGVLSLDFPSPMPNETISGILGYDFIKRFAVEIDFSKKVMRPGPVNQPLTRIAALGH